MAHNGEYEVEYMEERDAWLIEYRGHWVAVQPWSPGWWVRWRIGRLIDRVDSGYYKKKYERKESKENKIIQGRKNRGDQIKSIVKDLV